MATTSPCDNTLQMLRSLSGQEACDFACEVFQHLLDLPGPDQVTVMTDTAISCLADISQCFLSHWNELSAYEVEINKDAIRVKLESTLAACNIERENRQQALSEHTVSSRTKQTNIVASAWTGAALVGVFLTGLATVALVTGGIGIACSRRPTK